VGGTGGKKREKPKRLRHEGKRKKKGEAEFRPLMFFRGKRRGQGDLGKGRKKKGGGGRPPLLFIPHLCRIEKEKKKKKKVEREGERRGEEEQAGSAYLYLFPAHLKQRKKKKGRRGVSLKKGGGKRRLDHGKNVFIKSITF